MPARLWIREPSGKFREQMLDRAATPAAGWIVGRSLPADIVLEDPAVSRQHARIAWSKDGWRIADLDSSNRTFLNGDPIKDALLAPGDHIGIGDSELQLIDEVARVPDDASRTQVLTRLGDGDTSGAGTPAGSRASAVLACLYRLSRDVAPARSSMHFLEQAIRILVEDLAADRGAVLLLEDDALLCRAAHSRSGQALRGFVLSQSIFRELMQSREAVLSRDTSDDSRFQERASVVGEEIRSVIAAPIRHGEQIRGILYLDRLEGKGTAFQREDLYGVAVAAEFLGATLKSSMEVKELQEERESLVKTLIDDLPIVGTSREIQRVRDFIRRAAPSDSTVLVLGETGTGKELVARAIHYQSGRRAAAFMPINCAAIPETLVESELFGHEKGAFTGAVERKIGKFEGADRGTVFLDEVAELPLGCQGKLLRLLEERCFERVGGNQSVHVDVRIVAATNRDAAAEVAAGRFREDLFYRLNVLQVKVPPLRERPEDLSILIDHFLDAYGARNGGRRKFLSPEARQRLLEQRWPGNVRQLRNAIESCVVMSSGDVIELSDLPAGLGPAGAGGAAGPVRWQPRTMDDVEREHIQRVLEHVKWNKSKAAEILGIERSTLYARLKNFNLKTPE